METVLRVAFVYVLILAVLRVVGKREVSQLTPMELVMLILIPELVSQALTRDDHSLTNGVVAVTTLLSLVFLTSLVAYRFRRVEEIIEGRPVLIVERGRPVQETMDRERIPVEEIAAEMRKAGFERLEDVKWGVLEAGGRLSFIGYTPGEGGTSPEEEDRPVA